MPFLTYKQEMELSDETYKTMFIQHYSTDPVFTCGKVMRHVVSMAIVNNVVTVTLQKKVDLLVLKKALSFMGAEYSPTKKFPSLGLHFAHDSVGQRTAINVFSTGKIVCSGCPTKYGALQSIMKIADMIEEIIPGVTPVDIVVRNIVGCVRLDVGIDLCALQCHIKNKLGTDTMFKAPTYESEDFPGLQWMDGQKRMYLLFTSGAMVITNGRTAADIISGAAYMHGLLYDCWKDNPTTIHELQEK